MLEETEIFVAAQVGEVGLATGDEVINTDDFMAVGEEQIGEMRAENQRRGHDGDGDFDFMELEQGMRRSRLGAHRFIWRRGPANTAGMVRSRILKSKSHNDQLSMYSDQGGPNHQSL